MTEFTERVPLLRFETAGAQLSIRREPLVGFGDAGHCFLRYGIAQIARRQHLTPWRARANARGHRGCSWAGVRLGGEWHVGHLTVASSIRRGFLSAGASGQL